MTLHCATSTLKAIVTEDFRAAAVFEKYSLDFCCNGGVTIDQACAARNVDAAAVFAELDNLVQCTRSPPTTGSREWNTEALIDHILAVHHAYVREAIPVLSLHTEKVARVHGERHPEVVLIAQHFATVAGELQHHMMKEERVLFPYIRRLAVARREGKRPETPHFGIRSQSHPDDGGGACCRRRHPLHRALPEQQLHGAGRWRAPRTRSRIRNSGSSRRICTATSISRTTFSSHPPSPWSNGFRVDRRSNTRVKEMS